MVRVLPGWFLLGLCGMGGPVMVLWVLAHDWPMNKARAFLFFLFTTGSADAGAAHVVVFRR